MPGPYFEFWSLSNGILKIILRLFKKRGQEVLKGF